MNSYYIDFLGIPASEVEEVTTIVVHPTIGETTTEAIATVITELFEEVASKETTRMVDLKTVVLATTRKLSKRRVLLLLLLLVKVTLNINTFRTRVIYNICPFRKIISQQIVWSL